MGPDLPAPGETATWRTTPLVVAACVEAEHDAARVLGALLGTHGDLTFVTVVGARVPADLGPLLDDLAPVMAERVLAAPGSDADVAADALARAALEVHGVGQDFVFQARSVATAVDIAVRAVTHDESPGWDGTAVLVVGAADVLAEAHAALPPDTPSSRG